MNAFYVKSVDSSDFLEHYGVMGMKWGVRKDGMPQGYQTKRKAKRSMKKAMKRYRKETGRRNTIGSHMAEVDAKLTKQLNSDSEYRALKKKSDTAWDKMAEAEGSAVVAAEKVNRATEKTYNARSIYDQVSERGTASQVLNAKKDYKEAIKAQTKAEQRLKEANDAYDKASDEYSNAENKRASKYSDLSKTFKEEQLNAAVKDLGFDDVSKGREMLKEYNLEEYALNPSLYQRGLHGANRIYR